MDISREVFVADYVISTLRKELGLGYEINDGNSPKNCICSCQLTDGESFLLVWFSREPIATDQWFKFEIDSGRELFLSWMNRDDSRRNIPGEVIKSLCERSIANLPVDDENPRVALASIQFMGRNVLLKTDSLICKLFPTALVSSLPVYRGRFYHEDGGAFSDEPNFRWTQIDFRDRILASDFVSTLATELRNLESFSVDRTMRFHTFGSLEKLGVRIADVLCRMF